MKSLTKEEYEARESCSQAVRCTSCEIELRKIAKSIMALAMRIEQRKLFKRTNA
jgi:hypothetical protein